MAYEGKPPASAKIGGTGTQSNTPNAPLCGGNVSTGAFQSADSGISNAGYVLTSTGASSLPTWQALSVGPTNIAGDTGTATGSTITFSGTSSGKTANFSAAVSTVSLNSTDGSSNTALGSGSGANLSGSSNNTLMGSSSGGVLTSGSHNTMIGQSAGSSGSATNSSNIYIKNAGANESNTIRIGTQGTGSGQQNTCFMAGVAGVSIAANKRIVTTNTSTGQIGCDTTLAVAQGGSGAGSLTGVLIGNGTSPMTANAVTANRVLIAGASNTVTSPSGAVTGTIFCGASGVSPNWLAAVPVTSLDFGSGPLSRYNNVFTWTPSLAGQTTAGTTTYTTRLGRAMAIGEIIIAFWKIVITAATGTGNVQITGLPITSESSSDLECVGSGWVGGFTYPTSTTDAIYTISPNSTRINVRAYSATTAAAPFQMINAAGTFMGTLVYFAA